MLETKFLGKELKNPLLVASGTFGFGTEFTPYMDLSRLGGLISKGLTIREKEGNSGIRIHETPSGIMNSIGLQNPGIPHFIEHELPEMHKLNDYIIANMGGNSLEDYIEGAKLLDQTDVDAIELNISCPNVKEGGMAFGIQCQDASVVVREIRSIVKKPLIVKLSPNAFDLKSMAKTVEAEGADAISLVNTFNALAVDVERRKPVFDNVTAGLSGPAIRPIAVRMVHDVVKSVKIPVIGIGGIMTASDALEFIMVGATLFEIGTANLVNPSAAIEIIEGMEEYMTRHGIKSLDEIRGII